MPGSVANSSAVEEVDCLVAELYSRLDKLEPRDRTLVVPQLLQIPTADGSKLRTPGLDADKMRNTLKARLGKKFASVDEKIHAIHSRLGGQALDYVAANYWSPAVNNRQSVVACQEEFASDILRNRFAVAFFAITFEARKDLLSLVQYLAAAVQAHQRRTVITLDTSHGVSASELGATANGIDLNAAGNTFKNAIATLVEQCATDNSTHDARTNSMDLRQCLLFGRPPGKRRWLRQVLDRYEGAHRDAMERLEPEQREALEDTVRRLRLLFCHDDLTTVQVGFFLGMQVLWQRAFGGRYLYALPTIVNQNCCVLTVGAHRPIEDRSLLAGFGRSLFANALLLDYGSSRESTQRRHYQSFVAHNIPKLVISPATAELRRVRTLLESEGELLSSEEVTHWEDSSPRGVVGQLRSLETLYEHYESLMARFRFITRDSYACGLPTTPESIRFNADIWPRLHAVFECLRGRVLDSRLRSQLKLVNLSKDETVFYADLDMITEILVNFIANAVDAIVPDDAAKSVERAWVYIEVRPLPGPPAAVQFRVTDKGEGIRRTKLRGLRRMIDEFSQVGEDKWGSLLDGHLNRSEWEPGAFENLGIGLPLCAAYARQLQWDLNYETPGSIHIESKRGHGTEVELTLPAGKDATQHTPEPERDVDGDLAAIPAAKTFLLTSDAAVVEAWRNVKGITAVAKLADIPSEGHVIVDAKRGFPDFDQLYRMDTGPLMSVFDRLHTLEDLEQVPKSILSLHYLSHKREEEGTGRCLLFLCEKPPAALVQELLRTGADWVCSSRTVPPRLPEIYTALGNITRSPSQKSATPRRALSPLDGNKRVLVVENSRSVCMALRRRLENLVELDFVGAELPGNRFEVSAHAALKRFSTLRQQGRLAGVIADLALDSHAELEVSERLQEDADQYAAESTGSWAKPDFGATTRLSEACQLIADLRASDEALTIIVLSDFVRIPAVQSALRPQLRNPHTHLLPKNQRGYTDLESILGRI